MSALSNNYKNSLKKLRKNSAPLCKKGATFHNYYKYLTEVEDNSSECVETVREKNAMNFNDLPEDIIFTILNFLPCSTRLAILKHKYNKTFIKSMINKVPRSIEVLKKIWNCAKIAKNLLESLGLLDYKGDLYKNLNIVCLSCFKNEAKPELYSIWYKEGFLKIILTAVKHYTKIYNNKTLVRKIKFQIGYHNQITLSFKCKTTYEKEVIKNVEHSMFHIFAILSKLK